jgi:hypothetical protein
MMQNQTTIVAHKKPTIQIHKTMVATPALSLQQPTPVGIVSSSAILHLHDYSWYPTHPPTQHY